MLYTNRIESWRHTSLIISRKTSGLSLITAARGFAIALVGERVLLKIMETKGTAAHAILLRRTNMLSAASLAAL